MRVWFVVCGVSVCVCGVCVVECVVWCVCGVFGVVCGVGGVVTYFLCCLNYNNCVQAPLVLSERECAPLNDGSSAFRTVGQ